ncbi:MAG: glycogen synthase GlgA [Defluviitaleaceae bacterium]|nr:glycogen synthase GlgA [Defluviitaleaceae bacterium]MCL2275727.1 glycogen synthase GlgA [Defluviitaleaceae bacterium]
MNTINDSSLKILLVAAEVAPYSQSGGLGDVAGSLPKALRAAGVDMRVVLPKYRTIRPELLADARKVGEFDVHLAWRSQYAGVYVRNEHGDGDSTYLIENDFYFARDTFYGYGDDFERFAFFSKAAIEMLSVIGFQADIIHFNDWHTGLGPTYLRDTYRGFTFYKDMKSIITIHNLHYQGVFGRDILWNVGLNDGYFTGGDLEFFGNASFLKGGICHADAVSTVSRTYAGEIQTPAYGYGMDGLLTKRGRDEGRLFGITNGIDDEKYNPATDPRIFENFTVETREKKRANKHELQKHLNLPVGDMPVISIISRLVEQKGLDIVAVILDELMSMDVQLVILGTGESRYENLFRHYAHRYPHKVSANITYVDTLAQRIYAGADIFLMPSIYEPCGLGQLFAMRYGAVPIVRRTGGLADTVEHFNPVTMKGNGFCFEDFLASGLMWAVREALSLYGSQEWDMLVQNAMNSDFSWKSVASEYIDMYEKVKAY